MAALAIAALAVAQSTTFTYQGLLKEAGAPANGVFDFRFRLFDAPKSGNPIGFPDCVDNVNVADGLFTVPVDFGQQFATPDGRYMRNEVRHDAGQVCDIPFDYTELSPRQALTAAPMATHAKSAFALDAADGSPLAAVVVDATGNVGVGTAAPTVKFNVRGGPMLVENIADQADLLWLSSERSWAFRQDGTGAATALKLQSIGGGGDKNFCFQTDGAVGIRGTGGVPVWVTGGDEVLRIIRGPVRGDGEILAGSGFTVRRLGTGDYFISVTRPFSSVPTVTASSEYTSAFAPSVALRATSLPRRSTL